jgi:hypothetical protein
MLTTPHPGRTKLNRAGHAIIRHLQAALRGIGSLIDGHPDGCDCDFCHWYLGDAERILADFKGLAWSIEQGAGMIGSSLYFDPDKRLTVAR